MRAWPLAALLLVSSARAGGVMQVPVDLVKPLNTYEAAPLYQNLMPLLPPGPRGDGSRNQLAAYLDAGDYARIQAYFKDRLLPTYTAAQPLTVRALAKVAPNSARFQGTELGKVTTAFKALDRPDSAPVSALNAQLSALSHAETPAEMSSGLDKLFDGIRQRRESGEISELYARFVIGEAAKPVNGSSLDDAQKKAVHSRLGRQMQLYSSNPPTLSGALR